MDGMRKGWKRDDRGWLPLNYNYFRKCLEESVFDEFKIKLNLMGGTEGKGWMGEFSRNNGIQKKN